MSGVKNAAASVLNIYEVEQDTVPSNSTESVNPTDIADKQIKNAKEDQKSSQSAKNATNKAVNKSILAGLGDLINAALAHGVYDPIDLSDANQDYVNKTYAIVEELRNNEEYKKWVLNHIGKDNENLAKLKHDKLKALNDFVGLDKAIYAAQYRLEAALGPVIDSWLGGEDYLQQIIMLLQNLRGVWEPICLALEPIRDYYSDLGSMGNVNVNGQNANLPLGLIAVDCLNSIIDYFEELIHQIELLASNYSSAEIDAMLKVAGRPDDNWGNSMLNLIKDMIKKCLECIQPYIQNCLLMLLLDAVNMFIQILKDAGLLEKPSGPLTLIPIAITLVRSIAAGGLQRVEEQIRNAGNKLIKIIKCMEAFARDPDIFTSAEISALDYRVAMQLENDGIDYKNQGDYFGKKYVSDALTRKFRKSIGSAINDGIAVRNDVLDNFNIARRLRNYLNTREEIANNESMRNAKASQAVSDGKETKSVAAGNANNTYQNKEVGGN